MNGIEAAIIGAPARLLDRAPAVAQMDAGIPSPCISICRMDDASGLCQGCFRTLSEITAWGNMGDDARRAMWRTLAERAQDIA